MPVLAAPGFLWAALTAAALVVSLHLLAWRRPSPTPLPTARFVPPAAVRTVARDVRLTDVGLLLVRVLALLLTGLALAGPSLAPSRSGAARVIVVDASRRVASVTEGRDSALTVLAGARGVSWIRVDSAARLVRDSTIGSRAEVRGRMSAGLVAAIREGNRLRRSHAMVEIVVISPFAAESWDAASVALREEWSGALRAIRVRARAALGEGEAAPASLSARDFPPTSDPIGAAFALAADPSGPRIRVSREPLSDSDSAWARGGGVLVSWPRASSLARTIERRPAFALLTSGARSVAGPFVSLGAASPRGIPVLRWVDGTVAAAESPLGAGCIRSVAVGVPFAGDAVLRPGFLGVVRELSAPCGGGGAALLTDLALAAWVRGGGARGGRTPETSSLGETVEPSGDHLHDIERWLLIAVAIALAVESWVRRRGGATNSVRALEPRRTSRDAA